MKINRTHILGLAGLAIAGAAMVATSGREPEARTAPPVQAVVAAAEPGWLPAAGNLAPGVLLYFGEHDRIYRGQIMGFVDTDRGEAAVLLKGGQFEVVLRKDIAIRDFWVRAD